MGAKMPSIRIVVADDHPLFRTALALTLGGEPDMEIVGEGASVADVLRLTAECQPHLVLLDVDMPGNAIGAIAEIGTICARAKSIFLTGIGEGPLVSSAMQNGAWGYLLKEMTGPELVQTVRKIHEGERYVTPSLAAELLSSGFSESKPDSTSENRFSSLSRREEEILSLIGAGLSNKEISRHLSLSERTVKHYTGILLQKLEVRNRVEAAVLNFARAYGIAIPDSLAQADVLWPAKGGFA
jgi:DNA-binding NarL/FixJ family response regulator